MSIDLHSRSFTLQSFDLNHSLVIPQRSYFQLLPRIHVNFSCNNSNEKRNVELTKKIHSRSCSFSHHQSRDEVITTKRPYTKLNRSFSLKTGRHSQVCFFPLLFPISSNLLIGCRYENRHLVTRCA
jgi:hypothetical protein